jgi:hypothetical protein
VTHIHIGCANLKRFCKKMNEADTVVKKPIVLPCIAGTLCVLCLFVIGQAGTVFPEMYKDFGIDPLPWNVRVISLFHWFWTLPLGIAISVLLIWGSRRWSRKTNRIADVACIVLAILIFFGFTFVAFMPCGGMSTIVTGESAEQFNKMLHH